MGKVESIGRNVENSELDRESNAGLSMGGESSAPLGWIAFYPCRWISYPRLYLRSEREVHACYRMRVFSCRFYDILEEFETNIPKLIPQK